MVPQVLPADVGVGAGWYYDDFSEEVLARCSVQETPQRIALSNFVEPVGATRRFGCVRADAAATEGALTLDTPCWFAPGGVSDGCASSRVPSGGDQRLSCDPLVARCGVRCESDADCARAGLGAFACDPTTGFALAGNLVGYLPDLDGDGDVDGDDAVALHGFCVNPACEAW